MMLREPLALLALVLVPLIVVIWRRQRGQAGVAALAVRLAIVVLLTLALARPEWGTVHSGPRLVVLVDQSASLSDETRAALAQRATALLDGHPADVRVLTFAAGSAALTADITGQPDPAGSQLAHALAQARRMLGAGGRIVVLSDGLATDRGALDEARAAGLAGITVDTGHVAPSLEDEVWIARIDVPRSLREGDPFVLSVIVGATRATSAEVLLTVDGADAWRGTVTLGPGETRVPYRGEARRSGVIRVEARVVPPAGDRFVENDQGAAVIPVAPAPRLLLVEGRTGAGAPLRAALRTLGVTVDVVAPSAVPAQLTPLAPYEGIVLIDVSAAALSLDQMATLREHVRSEGRGLVIAGGRSSFTLGGYADTPLEDVAPVLMEPPPRPERAAVNLLVIFDRSASMGPQSGASKFVMAKEAALLATESLRPEDRLGVLAFDIDQQWVVPFQSLTDGVSLAEIQSRIARVPLGGGTNIYGALEAGLDAMMAQDGDTRHVVLMTDGRSFGDQPEAFAALIGRARAADVTLSTIAIGEDADVALLADLAQLGAGRSYVATVPDDIPRLTLIESEIARSEPQIEGTFRAEPVAPHPALAGLDVATFPALDGYVGVTPKPQAELVLRSPEGDPVLAAWQYGLGRALAWLPGIAEPWAGAWLDWPGYPRFWSQLIRYTLPEPDSGLLQVRVLARDAVATIRADSLMSSGAPLDLADTQALVTLPDGTTRTVTLLQRAPGRYEQEVRLASSGAYLIEVRQVRDGIQRVTTIGYVHPVPAEYLPSTDRGAEVLAALSAASGGSVLPPDAPLLVDATPAAAPLTLWTWLIAAAVVLWPLAVALQRGWGRR